MTTTLAEQLADARRQLASERNPNTRKFWKDEIYRLTDLRIQIHRTHERYPRES